MNHLPSPWTPELTTALNPLILAQPNGREAIRAAWANLSDDVRSALGGLISSTAIRLNTCVVHPVPVLSPEACAEIVERSKAWSFAVNDDEADDYQIDEAIIAAHDPEFDARVKGWLIDTLGPVLMAIYGRLPDHYASLQLASYSTDRHAGSGLHIDYDADYTAVIALNDDFAGGGTMIADGLLGDLPLPALPVGTALIFRGRNIAHRGLPVTSGRRLIMTAWLNDDGARW